jgi:polyketide synthase PksL
MSFQTQGSELGLLSNIVQGIIEDVTGLSSDTLRVDSQFAEIGLDSLAVLSFNTRIEPHFPGLSKTLLFDCRCVKDVAVYLLEHQPEAAKKLLSIHQSDYITLNSSFSVSQDNDWPILEPIPVHPSNTLKASGDIAIVGMHGRFPGANSLNVFWENLLNGIDSVTEIPQERWPLNTFFEAETLSRVSGKSYAKWGGFLDNIDKFDAQFFNISPREAAVMDPQERVFLECAWHAMEDGALFGERSKLLEQNNGTMNIGVFVGVTTNTYSLLGPENWQIGSTEIPSGLPWSVANRVSYALNLSGPSMAIDTACSSSLSAMNMAIQSLRNNECSAAIVGGVNLYTHPSKYVQLCQQQMLSPTGHCYSFGKDADGFVPGEGVGAVILKPLAAALNDRDRVLAVIKGCKTNHGGHTNGYTVPSPASQAELIAGALSDTNISPDSISYIEAHGTGTRLGDPIEVEGLKQAIGGIQSSPSCAIGSVKANIGHLEAAAGIASLLKVVLQLKHKRIVPSIYSQDLNPALELENSRFYIPQTPIDWKENTGLLRAGISSFGAGGANAHVIVEEAPSTEDREYSSGPLVFLLSARSQPELLEMVRSLRIFVTEQHDIFRQSKRFSRLAYTFQCGRNHFEHRVAVLATDIEELSMQLDSFLQQDSSGNESKSNNWFAGRVTGSDQNLNEFDGNNPIPRDLAVSWVGGERIFWSEFWTSPPIPDSTPLYPFSKERHWISSAINESQSERKNVYAQIITGKEYFLRDHVISDELVLPASAYIDFCCAKARDNNLLEQLEFRNLNWPTPFALENGSVTKSIRCNLRKSDDGLELAFNSQNAAKEDIHFRCICRPLPVTQPRGDTLETVRARCTTVAPAEKFYPALAALGINYGITFRCLKAAWLGQNEALTELQFCHEGRQNEPLSELDPAMLDGVLQSAFFPSFIANEQIKSTFIPFSGKSLRVFAKLSERVFVHTQRQTNLSPRIEVFDFSVFSSTGELLMEIDDFAFRQYEQERVHLLEPVWKKEELVKDTKQQNNHSVVIFDNSTTLFNKISDRHLSETWLMLESDNFQYDNGRTIEGDARDPKHFELLGRLLKSKNIRFETLVINLTAQSSVISGNNEDQLIGLEKIKAAASILRNICSAIVELRLHIYLLVPTGPMGAISGLMRSLNLEMPTVTSTVVEIDPATLLTENGSELYSALIREIDGGPKKGVTELRLKASSRELRSMQFLGNVIASEKKSELTAGDVVVISGGLGGIGRLFAKNLAKIGGLQLAIAGRSACSAESEIFLKELKNLGADGAEYWQADCSVLNKVEDLVTSIRKRFGPISGIVHCAGVLQDNFFVRQSPEELNTVIQSKVISALWLDEVTACDPIKTFILCSSLAGTHGNVGQSSYAMANAWLDRFAESRHELVLSGHRHGNAVSVVWPLWQSSTGMQAPDYVAQWFRQNGLSLLPENEGVEIFVKALSSPYAVLVPVRGKYDSIARFLNVNQKISAEIVDKTEKNTLIQGNNIEEDLLALLYRYIAKVTGTPIAKIDPDISMEVYGLDSIMIMELNTLLEKDFPELSKTVLFEVRNLRDLAAQLISEHAESVVKISPTKTPVIVTQKNTITDEHISAYVEAPPEKNDERLKSIRQERNEDGAIAIIGLAGKYPESSDIEEYWKHLIKGDDLVSEIPKRWKQTEDGKEPYARWGSFIDDFDKFDPLFFGISPRDAERMDPQERLFLQCAWHAVEDGGYTPQTLSGTRNELASRRRVGVVAGVMYGEYQFYGAKSWPEKPDVLTNSSYASIANRVSFCLDLDGPSFAVDSMCSSSLTSIHLACGLIRNGDCEMALAGGVNLSTHPYKYRMLSDLNFASSEGKCRSFGEGGDGYVPGEGVGVVLLKSLKDALRDDDYIYGVIRGSDLNHGGKTSGYTVPNADAQAQVISRAFTRADISPQRLGYVEAHGTGTSLGDPIEIRGLSKAIGRQTPTDWTCPIGSVKSNIGHLESAAGIAALTKVLLQLKHRKLAPSIHSETLNQNIDFSKTPFFVQRELAEWRQPVDELGDAISRIAAISSFGAGGSNAHLIIEEFMPEHRVKIPTGVQAFVFSAHSDEQLKTYIRRFATFIGNELEEHETDKPEFLGRCSFTTFDVAKTLISGRRVFDCDSRMAIVAGDFSELYDQLNSWLDSVLKVDSDLHSYSRNKDRKGPVSDFPEGLAQAWLRGESVHLPILAGQRWRKVPLPGYEFLRRRYWATDHEFDKQPTPIISTKIMALRENRIESTLTPSTILEQLARKEISEKEARSLLLAMV